jgi:hypothetical protein
MHVTILGEVDSWRGFSWRLSLPLQEKKKLSSNGSG